MDPDFLTTHGSISCRTLIDHFFRDRHFGYIKGGFWLAHRKDFVENWNCAYNLFEGHEHYTNSFLRWRFLWKYYGTQAKGTDLDTSREKFATPSSGSVAYLLRYPRTVCSQCVVHRLWTDPVQGFFSENSVSLTFLAWSVPESGLGLGTQTTDGHYGPSFRYYLCLVVSNGRWKTRPSIFFESISMLCDMFNRNWTTCCPVLWSFFLVLEHSFNFKPIYVLFFRFFGFK